MQGSEINELDRCPLSHNIITAHQFIAPAKNDGSARRGAAEEAAALRFKGGDAPLMTSTLFLLCFNPRT